MGGQPWSRTKRTLAPIGAIALLLLVFSASAASAAGSHGAKAAQRTNTAGLKAHLPLSALNGYSSLVPGRLGRAYPAATSSTIGAGQYAFASLVSAGVTFTMPNFSCVSNTDQEWLPTGLWIFDSGGALQSQVDVNFNCNAGVKYQQALICIPGATCDESLTVNPGDVIEAVYVQDAASAVGELFDRTQHTYVVVYGTPSSGGNYVLAGELGAASFGVTSVPTFNKVAFKTATLNGFYLSDWAPSTLNLQNGSRVQIKSGPVKTTNFVTRFVHNS